MFYRNPSLKLLDPAKINPSPAKSNYCLSLEQICIKNEKCFALGYAHCFLNMCLLHTYYCIHSSVIKSQGQEHFQNLH